MKIRVSCILMGAALGIAATVVAQDKGNVMRPAPAAAPLMTRFIKLEAFDFKSIVPPPPAAGSLAAKTDLETVLQVQAWRTPEEIDWAKLVERDTVFNHASILGEWFKPDRLPLTAVFFKHIADDMRALDTAAKKPFQRARPSTVDPHVQPCVAVPVSTSYPSGSATQAFVWAELLAEAMPSKHDALIARAHRAAWGRVIGGVHFPSDLTAGQLLAQAYLTECRKSPAFREAFEACKRELVAALATPVAPQESKR